MAKVWARDGARVHDASSYMLELVMLAAYDKTPPKQRGNYQIVFHNFLLKVKSLTQARIFFTKYIGNGIPAEMLGRTPIVLSLSDPFNNLAGPRSAHQVQSLQDAAKKELDGDA